MTSLYFKLLVLLSSTFLNVVEAKNGLHAGLSEYVYRSDFMHSICGQSQDFTWLKGNVYPISRTLGNEVRCYLIYIPPTTKFPLPVHIFFHGRHDFASRCLSNNTQLVHAAQVNHFALVCAEASLGSDIRTRTGVWNVSNLKIDDMHPQTCTAAESREIRYFAHILRSLKRFPYLFDVGYPAAKEQPNDNSGTISLSGFSQGAALVLYLAVCFSKDIGAIIQVATGIKLAHDGVQMPGHEGACKSCGYWPVQVPSSLISGKKIRHCAFQQINDVLVPFQTTINICELMGQSKISTVVTMAVLDSSKISIQNHAVDFAESI